VGENKTLEGKGLFELRLKAPEGIARVFYGTIIGKKILILHQFLKKTEKTPGKELTTTVKRLMEIKNAHTQGT
jgi:phage-related protein